MKGQDAKISLERLNEIEVKEDEEGPEDNRIDNIPSGNSLTIRNVSFQYGGPKSDLVVRNGNIEILAKKITAIVGTSGSGKTTLLKLLLGFYRPLTGQIVLKDTTLDKYKPSSWRKCCGVVMQEGFIFSDTIENNIALADQIPDPIRIERAVVTANIKEFIESLPLGYRTLIGNDGHGLSSGQRQRILIARAVYKNPDFIFLDEATNALDATSEATIMNNLDSFFRGKTVVIIAHRLSTVKKADQIIVLERGAVVEKVKRKMASILFHRAGKQSYNAK